MLQAQLLGVLFGDIQAIDDDPGLGAASDPQSFKLIGAFLTGAVYKGGFHGRVADFMGLVEQVPQRVVRRRQGRQG